MFGLAHYWQLIDSPIIEFHLGGQLSRILFGKYGSPHRINGPAVICYSPYGHLEAISYWVNAKLHNENGPAYLNYSSNKEIIYKSYHLYDEEIEINNDEEFKIYKKHLCLT